MSITSADDRRTRYNPVVATTDFAADFPVFDNDDIKVYVDGVERDDFAVTATYVEGISTDAKAVFAVGVTGTVDVVGYRDPHRTNRFSSGAPVPPRDLNLAIDTLEGEAQEARRDIERAVKTDYGADPQTLPTPSVGKVLGWSSDGKLVSLGGISTSTPASPLGEDIMTASTVDAVIALLGGRRMISTADYVVTSLAAQGYAQGAVLHVKQGETVKLTCNPTLGDDFEAMCAWAASGHMVERGGEFYVEIADGLHYVDTQISVFGGRQLDIRATAAPDQRTITAISFTNISGNVYDATITVSSAVPAQAVAGNVVGLYDVQGDGGAGAVNGGHVLQSVAVDGLSFVVRLQVTGVVPTNPTALTTSLTPVIGGMGINLAIFPKATIQADQAGWDGGGGPYEGFMEARSGGRIVMTNLGIMYDAVTTGADPNADDDMLFAHGHGSEISLADQCVIGGTGEMLTRSFNNGHIHAYRSCLGGRDAGVNFWQGSYGGTALFQRSMLGSVSGIGISASAASRATIDKCVLAGANQIARPTYPTADITITNSRLVGGNFALTLTKGLVSIDAASLIDRCTSPISMAGGELWGSPTITNCTNAAPTGDTWDANGGAWHKTNAELASTRMQYIGTASSALDFPSIAAQSYQDLTITVTGAAVGNAVMLARQGTWPAQGVIYTAFVSAVNTVTVRAYNITGAAIDPTAATWKVSVYATS